MSATAVLTMVLILAFVWGGLLLILGTAVRKERGKRQIAGPEPPAPFPEPPPEGVR